MLDCSTRSTRLENASLFDLMFDSIELDRTRKFRASSRKVLFNARLDSHLCANYSFIVLNKLVQYIGATERPRNEEVFGIGIVRTLTLTTVTHFSSLKGLRAAQLKKKLSIFFEPREIINNISGTCRRGQRCGGISFQMHLLDRLTFFMYLF